MNTLILRRSAVALVIGLFTALPSGCAVTGGGYGYDESVGVGVDYYEPYGADYGGWAPGYRVGPPRGRRGGPDHRGGGGGSRPSPHAYRPAPASHPMPSIPSGSRSGGGRR